MNSKIFEKSKPLIGVLQLLPLPGSVQWDGRIERVIARAEQEATALATGGVDGIIVENTFDAPYPSERMDMAGAIAMGLIIRRIMHFTHLPVGVNVLRNDPKTALAIAMNVGARFIRVSLLTGAAISESGIMEGRYHDLATYRQLLKVKGISVFADISMEKTAPLVTNDSECPVTLKTLARQSLEYGGADGIILTDRNISLDAIKTLKESLDAPVFYDYTNSLSETGKYLQATDGLIVSSVIKKSSLTTNEMHPTIDIAKVEELKAYSDINQADNNIESVLFLDR